MPAIGIDLGTTNSCVAVVIAKEGQKAPDVIANEQGNRTTPSCVAFTEEDSLVGEAAKRLILKNTKSTVFDIKRIIGRRFTDPMVQEQKEKWDFGIVDENGKIKIEVTVNEQHSRFYPEQISAKILEYMKKVAEDYIGEEVQGAVITVPAYFNNSQRSATKDAAAIAGLQVLGMINEPTAAAIAYELQHENDSQQNILIYDLGGGTFDATVMTIKDGIFDVKATTGDTNLGGEDFTEHLLDDCAKVFQKKIQNKDSKTSIESRYRLMMECEAAKRQLSAINVMSTDVFVHSLCNGESLDLKVTRATFESLNETLFSRSLSLVEELLREAKMEARQIDEVILVGGSTRIPYIQEMLGEYFGENKLRKTINPDEAVACGAAILASNLSGDVHEQTAKIARMKLLDVTPLSLGTTVGGNIMDVIIKRNTKIPTRQTRTYTTSTNGQDKVEIDIYEGESQLITENNLLASFELGGISPMPARVPNIEVCFEIDSNGVLHVSATETRKGNKKSMIVATETARMSNEEIQRLVQEVDKQRRDDERWKTTNKAMNELESYANRIQKYAETKSTGMPDDIEAVNGRMMVIKCDSIKGWIARNKGASEVDITSIREELQNVYSTLFPGLQS